MYSLVRAVRATPTLAAVRRLASTARGNDQRVSPSPAPRQRSNGDPGWSEDLATASEAFVKADRETTSINEMRQKTVDYAQSHHRDPEIEQTHASYAREEVGGPLGSSGMGEFEGVVGHDDLGPDDAQIESNGRVVTRRVMHKKTSVHEGESGAGHTSPSPAVMLSDARSRQPVTLNRFEMPSQKASIL